MAVDKVGVEGLREFLAELRKVDAAFPKEVRAASKSIADKVAEGTRAAFSSMAGSAPKVAPTVKALAQQRGAQVKVGGRGNSVGERVAVGNTFGSDRYPQFPPTVKGGYALFPTIESMRDETVDEYGDAAERVLAKAFPTKR